MKKASNWLRNFRKDEEGTIAIELVLIIPALFWAYLAMFAIFDAYRQYSVNQKGAYTLGDMVSRETTPINGEYLNGSRELLQYLTNTRELSDVAIRVSSLKFDADNDIYELDWSEKRGWVTSLSASQVENWHDRLPVMTNNEYVTVVETWVKYDPPFNTGLSNREIQNFIFTKPRYAPRVLYEGTP